jgi:hypothetical protein
VSGAAYCTRGSLEPDDAKGKIVVCDVEVEPGRDDGSDTVEKGFVVKEAGGVGMVLCNDPRDWQVTADAHVLPAAPLTTASASSTTSSLPSTYSVIDKHGNMYLKRSFYIYKIPVVQY